MEQESLFLSYVQHILKRWNGFQAALNEGMGGQYAKEKVAWLGQELLNYFKLYDDVSVDEVAEYLGTMIENEFDTYFEDGSLTEVSSKFCMAYKLSSENPNAEIFQEIEKTVGPQLENHVASEMKTEEQVACEAMEELMITDKEESDGWTTVTRNRKVK